jgi:hypothetical protein
MKQAGTHSKVVGGDRRSRQHLDPLWPAIAGGHRVIGTTVPAGTAPIQIDIGPRNTCAQRTGQSPPTFYLGVLQLNSNIFDALCRFNHNF